MLQRKFEKTGWEVGVIGFGAWGIGGQWGPVEKQTALDTIHTAIDCGMNFIDTADAYGDPPGLSERFLSEVVGDRRDQLIVATKVGNYARRHGHPLSFGHWLHVTLCCDASLHRLGTDYIDLYQCHIANCEDATVFLEGFDRLREAGKIRAFGISTDSLDVARAFNAHDQCVAVQLDYSYLNRRAERDLLPYCREYGIGTIIRGPLAKGVATGKFTKDSTFSDAVRQGWNDGPRRQRFLDELAMVDRVRSAVQADGSLADLALRFVISHPAVTVAIPGAKDPAQARANAAAGEAPLDDAALDAIRQATAA